MAEGLQDPAGPGDGLNRIGSPAETGGRYKTYGFYINDDYKVTPRAGPLADLSRFRQRRDRTGREWGDSFPRRIASPSSF